ncbi:DNA-3-methyladenine glycosylase [Lithobates pipiens]
MATKRKQIQTLKNQKIFIASGESTIQREPSTASKYFLSEKTRLSSDFYEKSCIDLAKSFLGQILVRKLPDGSELRAKIVETESYLGGEDEASHSRGGKRTERNIAMYMKPGTIYVYQIYGVYFCMNVSSKGDGAAVLLRSLEPVEGLDEMRSFRSIRRNASKSLKDKELCNGPSKLCQALNFDKSFDRRDLASDQSAWLEAGSEVMEENIVSCARIGIGYAGEWTHKPLRFYIKGNQYVSVRDKAAEGGMTFVHTNVLVDNK